MQETFKDKIIVVTGGTGTIGAALVKALLRFEPRQVRVLSRDETKQYYLQEKLNYPKCLRLFVGDVRDRDRLDLAFQGADIVFHAAALKHVPSCEYNPFEAVKTNILGSQHVIDSALKNKVKKVIAVSTDKAVNPINIMGTTKLMMEKLFINANYYTGKAITKFSCVRFGNVAWSRGSVLSLWKKQAKNGGVIRLTNSNMTRFLMSKKQAICLTLKAGKLTQGGEIFIFKMPSMKLTDLAEVFIEKYFPGQGVNIELVGDRVGEKTHEELFNKNDKYKQFLEDKEMFIVVPELQSEGLFGQGQGIKEYPGFVEIKELLNCSSEQCLDIEKIKAII